MNVTLELSNTTVWIVQFDCVVIYWINYILIGAFCAFFVLFYALRQNIIIIVIIIRPFL